MKTVVTMSREDQTVTRVSKPAARVLAAEAKARGRSIPVLVDDLIELARVSGWLEHEDS